MRNGTQTRENIIRQAAALFNRQGFAGASMSDIMQATGLQKGGIYRHFESKEALALEAFDYAVAQMAGRFTAALEGREHAVDRLGGIVGVFARLHDDPPVPGGCPMMNTAVQTDDAESPALRDRARTAMRPSTALPRTTGSMGAARTTPATSTTSRTPRARRRCAPGWSSRPR